MIASHRIAVINRIRLTGRLVHSKIIAGNKAIPHHGQASLTVFEHTGESVDISISVDNPSPRRPSLRRDVGDSVQSGRLSPTTNDRRSPAGPRLEEG
jgi:hypothetical protein